MRLSEREFISRHFHARLSRVMQGKEVLMDDAMFQLERFSQDKAPSEPRREVTPTSADFAGRAAKRQEIDEKRRFNA